METSNYIWSTFWSENIWLPPNTTWNDVKRAASSNIHYSEAWYMFFPVAVGIALVFVRQFIEKRIFAPLGMCLGIKNIRPRPPKHNEVLERSYSRNRRLHLGMVRSLEF